jgi:hypothetical protein
MALTKFKIFFYMGKNNGFFCSTGKECQCPAHIRQPIARMKNQTSSLITINFNTSFMNKPENYQKKISLIESMIFSVVGTITLACAAVTCVLPNFVTGSAAAMLIEVKSTKSLKDAKQGSGPRQLHRHYKELKEVCQIEKEAGGQDQFVPFKIKMCMALPECSEEEELLTKPTLETEAELQKWMQVGREMTNSTSLTAGA